MTDVSGTEYNWAEPDVKPTRRWSSDIPATEAAPSAGVGTEYLYNTPPSIGEDVGKSMAAKPNISPVISLPLLAALAN